MGCVAKGSSGRMEQPSSWPAGHPARHRCLSSFKSPEIRESTLRDLERPLWIPKPETPCCVTGNTTCVFLTSGRDGILEKPTLRQDVTAM